jgi:hypothetical protein
MTLRKTLVVVIARVLRMRTRTVGDGARSFKKNRLVGNIAKGGTKTMDKKTDIDVENISEYLTPIIQDGNSVLSLITLYDKPSDYPEKYVARLWIVRKGIVQSTNIIMIADTLDELKKRIPSYMQYLDRETNDDPKIVGVYL